MDNFCHCQKFFALNLERRSFLHLFAQVYDLMSNLVLSIYQTLSKLV